MKVRTLVYSVFLMLAVLASALATGDIQDEFHQTYAFSPQGRVSLDNINGAVHIVGWDRNEVRVDAVKRASNRERLNEAHIEIEPGRNVIAIHTRYPDRHNNYNPASVEYTLSVPRGARLDEIKLVNGRLEITGVTGDVRASSVNGAVKAEKLAGETKLSTVNGRVEAGFERLDASKSISINSVNGSIALSIPFDAHAELRANNVTGGIENDFGLPVDRGRFVGSNLNATLKGGGTRIKLSNVNGSIRITPVANGRRVRFT
jgi:hypothetical protein